MGNYCDRFLKIYLSSYVQVLRQMTQMSDWKCSYVIYLCKSSFLRCETLKSPLPKKKKKKSKTPYNFDGKRKNPFNWISWLSSNKLFFLSFLIQEMGCQFLYRITKFQRRLSFSNTHKAGWQSINSISFLL